VKNLLPQISIVLHFSSSCSFHIEPFEDSSHDEQTENESVYICIGTGKKLSNRKVFRFETEEDNRFKVLILQLLYQLCKKGIVFVLYRGYLCPNKRKKVDC